ncbi:polysaccharide biosynthesis tyrosine autokinase [Variovorax sp. dw_308]|uniref:polysaccharide biosynthesis tyrosine autokinase n=1 Tax=Variovorax sp. dw_308 TaxID=2721546 RepID=UPI00210E11CA|nr:polysaccharide biosynthesis tyrosine autokinase [Variovorax sp. dw_308]
MNPPQINAPGMPRPASNRDDINLLELLDVVLDNRWLIASVTAFAIVLGVAYAFLGTPIYEANTMIQVEDSKGDPMSSMLGSASGIFDIRSPATGEIEILRSRLVVEQAVENLRLYVEVTPKYVPLVGRWLARRAKAPSNPGILGMGGYVSGNESLTVEQFEVPDELEGQRFKVRLTVQGYELVSPDSDVVGAGVVGQPLNYEIEGGKGKLVLAGARGKPGAEFYITRYFPLNVTEDLQKDLKIAEQGKQSGVIRATLEGKDPRGVARVLNEIGTLYVRQNTERKAAEAEKSLSFLDTFLPQLRHQMEESETKFNQFRNRNSTFDLDAEGKALLEATVQLRVNLLTLQQKRKELLALYTPEHFSIRTVDAQISAINAKLDEANRTVKTLPNIEQELLSLTRDVKVNGDLYVNLLNSAQQLRLVKEGKVGNVRIVDVAAVTKKPVKPQRSLVVALAAVLGLLGGLALAFLRNSLRPGIKDPADIEQHSGLHVFASVPHSEAQVRLAEDARNKVPGSHVLAVVAPQEPAVESLRSLRTALQFAMLDAANNVILITGPTPGLGKSFTSVNLAAVLGAVSKKVLLIDADLRKGHLSQYFGLGRENGLSEVVSGGVKLEDALHRAVAPGVDFLSTGILPPNPAELLMSPATAELVRRAEQQYDMVIIDTPPVLAASDTAILASLAGAVFLVARAEITTLGELNESNKRLIDIGVKTKGVIFNDLNTSKRRYGYGVGYKYSGYRYATYKY